jgi:hypothetical protein
MRLREPEPVQIGLGVQKVAVTMEVTLGNGQVVTYEWHNVTFDPQQLLPDSFMGRTHGIDVKQWRPECEDDLSLHPRERLVPRQEPEELDLHIRGTLRPRSDTDDATGRVTCTPHKPKEGQ